MNTDATTGVYGHGIIGFITNNKGGGHQAVFILYLKALRQSNKTKKSQKKLLPTLRRNTTVPASTKTRHFMFLISISRFLTNGFSVSAGLALPIGANYNNRLLRQFIFFSLLTGRKNLSL